MKQFLLAIGAFAFVAAAVATAQDPPPVQAKPLPAAQAKGIQIQPAQPLPGTVVGGVRVTAAKMATLEEEYETLEAHRDVKKAYLKAAEVAAKGAEVQFDLIGKANVSAAERLKAQLEVEAAKAQIDIRSAELREVDVKLKFAKKRLDEAKAAGVIGKVAPKAVDPPPPQ